MTKMIEDAAKYVLRYTGQRGTKKQIARFLRMDPQAIIRMAVARGWIYEVKS